MQNQIDRIKAAENALNRAKKAVGELGRAWSAYTDAREDIALPERYLVSDDRRIDLEADEVGQLPRHSLAECCPRTRFGIFRRHTTS